MGGVVLHGHTLPFRRDCVSSHFSLCGVSFPIPQLHSVIAADAMLSGVPQLERGGVGTAFLSSRVTSQACGHANGEMLTVWFQVHGDGSPAGSASALVLSVSWKESLPVSPPKSPVKGHDLPALRLVSLYTLGRLGAGGRDGMSSRWRGAVVGRVL